MKKFIFQVIIEEGSDEFWEELEAEGKTGIEDITADINEKLFAYEAEVKLLKFTNE